MLNYVSDWTGPGANTKFQQPCQEVPQEIVLEPDTAFHELPEAWPHSACMMLKYVSGWTRPGASSKSDFQQPCQEVPQEIVLEPDTAFHELPEAWPHSACMMLKYVSGWTRPGASSKSDFQQSCQEVPQEIVSQPDKRLRKLPEA